MAPILKNEQNLKKFPQCIADDIKRQVHELSTSVYQIRGHIKGKTLLPFPQVSTVSLTYAHSIEWSLKPTHITQNFENYLLLNLDCIFLRAFLFLQKLLRPPPTLPEVRRGVVIQNPVGRTLWAGLPLTLVSKGGLTRAVIFRLILCHSSSSCSILNKC